MPSELFRSRLGGLLGLLLLLGGTGCEPLAFGRDVHGIPVAGEPDDAPIDPEPLLVLSGATDPLVLSPGCSGRRLADALTHAAVEFSADGHAVYAYARKKDRQVVWGSTRAGSRDEALPGIAATYVHDVAFDAKGQLVLLLHTAQEGVRLARKGEEGWSTETVAANGAGLFLKLDDGGNVHVGFTRENDSDGIQVFHATNSSGVWSESQVVDDVSYFSMEVDPQGFVHVLYYIAIGDESVRPSYATNRTGAWVHEPLSLDGGEAGSVQLDSLGNPTFLFKGSDGLLEYRTRTSTGWDARSIGESDFDVPNHFFLAPDGTLHWMFIEWEDHPVVAYGRHATGRLEREIVASLPAPPEPEGIGLSLGASFSLGADGARRFLIQHMSDLETWSSGRRFDEILCPPR